VNGNICLPPNTWQHWRMLVADQDATGICSSAPAARSSYGAGRGVAYQVPGRCSQQIDSDGCVARRSGVRCSSDLRSVSAAPGGEYLCRRHTGPTVHPMPPMAVDLVRRATRLPRDLRGRPSVVPRPSTWAPHRVGQQV
jgi:hypothetical protein